MDAMRFDYLTRSLTDASSRRGVLRGLAAALGLTVMQFPLTAEARKKRRKKKNTCTRGKKKCGKACIPKASCCTDADCPEACFCAARKVGGDLCIDAFDGGLPCSDDADCPQSSVCLDLDRCSVPCLE